MGGLGRPYGQPGHRSPNVGGSVMLEADHRPTRMREQMPVVVCSPISHRKLSRISVWLLRTQLWRAPYFFTEDVGSSPAVRANTGGGVLPFSCATESRPSLLSPKRIGRPADALYTLDALE